MIKDFINIKLYFQSNLDNILCQIVKFLRKYDSNLDIKEKIDEYLYQHSIYKNKSKIEEFIKILNDSGLSTKKKIIEIKEQSDMCKKRKKELEKINNFLKTTDFNTNQEKYLLPSGENGEKYNDIKNDDILFEDTKEAKNEFIGIKRLLYENQKSQNKFDFACYICKKKLIPGKIHQFYGNICEKCGNYNYSLRTIKIDLYGRIAIVTGGRIKIGFYISTKLLSYGCKVITTTRFPKDTLFKYKAHPDYEKWKNNLTIYPIDFRFFDSTIKFIEYINDNFPHLDILINNAAQTIRRTSSYYKYLLPIETKELNKEDALKIIKNDYLNIKKQLPEGDIKKEKQNSLVLQSNQEYNELLPLSVITSQIKIMEEKNHPNVKLMGDDGQPYDFSNGKNSWNFEFDEIPFQEFTEVQIINAWTPYYLCAKLKPLMLKSPFPDKYIVNVTAVEGIFNHFKKTTHVHTNMAKAELNMFTRTCGKYLKNQGIYMTCVDTGWVSPMNEMNNLLDKNTKDDYEKEFTSIPLDELDGAMRVLHPIIEGIKNQNYFYGILLKDYVKSDW